MHGLFVWCHYCIHSTLHPFCCLHGPVCQDAGKHEAMHLQPIGANDLCRYIIMIREMWSRNTKCLKRHNKQKRYPAMKNTAMLVQFAWHVVNGMQAPPARTLQVAVCMPCPDSAGTVNHTEG